MKVRFAVLADYANLTQEGKLNIMGIFERIHSSNFPMTLPSMQLVIRFEADISEAKEQKEVRVRLINEHGQRTLELGGRITIGEPKAGTFMYFGQLLTLRNVAFASPGSYQFDIYIDDELKHSVPLKVVPLRP